MRLNEEEYYRYIDIHHKLMYYTGKEENLIPNNLTFQEFFDLGVQEKFPIRETMYDNIEILDRFIADHSNELSEEDVDMILQFKHFKRGMFYVMKLLDKHALFMDDDFVYGVLALSDPFHSFWGNNVPIMVQAVLLPYNGKIIYDGMMSTYPVRLGKGITSSMKNDFNISKSKYGIITQLPISEEIIDTEIDLEVMLLTMMKTNSSREQNWYEIEQLIDENPKLIPVFYKQWGKINSRAKKKEIKELGITNQHFAIYDDIILTSGNNLKDVQTKIKTMIKNNEIVKSIHYFKV